MRAPAEIRTTEEFVAAIADELGDDPTLKAHIGTMVKVVRDLKDLPPMIGNRRRNAKYARKVLKWINEGEKLFEDPPEGAMLEMLFASRQTGWV